MAVQQIQILDVTQLDVPAADSCGDSCTCGSACACGSACSC